MYYGQLKVLALIVLLHLCKDGAEGTIFAAYDQYLRSHISSVSGHQKSWGCGASRRKDS
jgi:hypothetical protein